MGQKRQRLIKLFDGMEQQQQDSLLDYAAFLLNQQEKSDPTQSQQKLAPDLSNPRPEEENVVNAIKRLRASYYMLNADNLFSESSTLMAQFMLHGRDADEVIDDLQQLFEDHYQKYLEA